jgi:hypothetical protein
MMLFRAFCSGMGFVTTRRKALIAGSLPAWALRDFKKNSQNNIHGVL